MEYIKNGIVYKINQFDTLEEILRVVNLAQFSMLDWYDLLLKKDGIVYKSVLITILNKKIESYDTSEEINGFLVNGLKYWLDKATRVGLMHLANCSKDNIQLVLGDKILTIPVDKAKDFLALLEVYAGLCYLQTQKHLLAIKELKTVEDIINYDYTKGYPEKITFNYE